MVAYICGEAAGWLGFGPRHELGRLVRSRTIPKVDDKPVWSVFCFLVRVGYRRKGVGSALLRGVIEYARERGVIGLEAYPVDTGGRRIQAGHGRVRRHDREVRKGWVPTHPETDARSDHLPRWLMRLDL